MTHPSQEPVLAPADLHAFRLDGQVVKAFARLTGGFWKGRGAGKAWALTLGLAAFLLLSLAATLALNRWQRWFFDALEQKDAGEAGTAMLAFPLIIATMAAVGVGIVMTRESLQARWRAFLAERLIDRWLERDRYYHLAVTRTEPANPEYRITDDTRWATEPLVDLAIGLFSAVFGAAAFIGILWSVGGSITFTLAGAPVTVPAYMVLVAVGYGAIASGLMVWVGRRLVACVGAKNAAEGEFRFALMRLRENAESIALMGGSRAEQAAFSRTLEKVVARWLAIVRQHGRLTWITNSSGPMIAIVPLLFAAPKYFAGQLTLGEVMQLSTAFVQVQMAISWVVDNFSRIAEWYASARRVMAIVEACDDLEASLADVKATGISTKLSRDGQIRLFGVTVIDTSGRPLIVDAELAVGAGERVQILGGSSAGKSTLVRALAGLWPWGKGRIELPAGARVMVLPQKTYLPSGSLREAVLYPLTELDLAEGRIETTFRDVGLGHLVPQLDLAQLWQQVLSHGERQRLAIARVLLQRPDVVVLDEGLSAMDEDEQVALLRPIGKELPGVTIVSLGQRASADRFFTRRMTLEHRLHGAELRLARVAAV